MTWNGSCTEEVRSRRAMGGRAFEKVKDLTARRIQTGMRRDLLNFFFESSFVI